ncbi:cytochrome-c peroxidase [Sphingobacterium pedocola]|uniref:Cytochrome-c peroxidase n=1 Tax=Sphingobacterium pedocola TaxID=2082722 RepID=A0ABR9T4R5_9SPHI|nr:cytochrome c peroxidase [Sphingobacterium pedocola]MBE8720323.1 cytochrome-c peroxidase [Sphingobacterium pedocola]
MRQVLVIISFFLVLLSCSRDDVSEQIPYDNPEIPLGIPHGFPPLNGSVNGNKPTRYGAELGKKLFHEKRFSGNNTISCASCHNRSKAFADNNIQAIGINGRVGLRNTPPIQNLAFMKFYNWDGNILQLEKQPLVPIITHEEMNSSILEVIRKIRDEYEYKDLFRKAFGDEDITPDRIYRSIAQYEYTLISANSKYDRVKRDKGETFTENEERGYQTFKIKCASCHSTELFTDQSFRNVGFPLNPSAEEAGRARVTGIAADFMRFRVPSLRNVEYTAPYGSFGQFPTLRAVLDYFDNGVLDADNLDPILKENGNRIPLTEQEKQDIISFIKTLSDSTFVRK